MEQHAVDARKSCRFTIRRAKMQGERRKKNGSKWKERERGGKENKNRYLCPRQKSAIVLRCKAVIDFYKI